ncbi:MAG: hypothetical protein J5795_00335 [Lachnospiraceae bacterium]|nr:hypothetical protein [Lachnospiraceae bacterium]
MKGFEDSTAFFRRSMPGSVIGSIRIAVETVKIFNYHRNFRKSQEKPKKEIAIFAVVLIKKKDFHRNF